MTLPAPPDDAVAPLLSVVIPAHNEALGIEHTLTVIEAILNQAQVSHQLIVVDDGSRDGTFDRLTQLTVRFPQLLGLRLSRNFGKEAALLAGLRAAQGAAVVTLDADLQHPPEIIPQMLETWRAGARVVHGVKQDRTIDSPLSRARASIFNGIMSRLGGVDLQDASDFKLLDRVVVDILTRSLPERGRFYRGLASWVGFRQSQVQFKVAERHDHTPGRWSLVALVRLANIAIVSFTSAPLQLVTLLGLSTLVFGILVGFEVLWTWWHGQAVSGATTIILTLLILGSFIMISLGIIGTYLAKIYDEIKGRPPYFIEASCGGTPPARPT